MTASLEAVVIPGMATSSRDIRFTTDEQTKRFIDTGDRNPPPVGIRFTRPSEQIVNHPPSEVRACGRLILRVEEFHQHGIVIGAQLPGVDVDAEISYRERNDGRQVVAASSPDNDLLVEIEEEVWVPWRERLYILEALVRITNTTGNRKELHGFVFASRTSTAGALVDIDLRREVERRKGQHNPLPRMLDAGESVTAWVVNVLDRPVGGGHGGYEVGTRDEMNNDYAVVRPGEPGRQRVWGAALADKREEG
jgi:hypothetical protein